MAQNRVLIEAESFADKGGWVVDQQFPHLMGSSYLLAHGMGRPVANAKTKVEFPAAGPYRLWVRTKNWIPGKWEAPGRFLVILNGEALPVVFGTRNEWGWQDGGDVAVAAGTATVELEDLTGFDGRCDALFFTDDLGDVPPNDLPDLRKWRNALRGIPETPPPVGHFDAVIVGGGISGCAAALAAAHEGIKVALIHDRPVLGGNASGEVRVHTEGIYSAGEAILSRIDTIHWPNGSAKALQDDEKRHEAMEGADHITFFLSWRAYDVHKEGEKISAVYAKHIETGEVMSVEAPIFIDCTGDGWIGYWAGAEYRYGREAVSEFDEGWDKWGELWSPERPDNRVMGSSLLWYARDTGKPVSFPDVPWAMDVAKDHVATKGEWYWEFSHQDQHAIDDAEEIRDHMLRAIYGSFANAKKQAKHADYALDWVGYLSGKRESRRLMGDYVYSMKDVTENRYFPDTVVTEKRDIDVHFQQILREDAKPGTPDFLSTAIFHPVEHYYLPFRSLYSRNIPNLMMAGRCFSCTHVGLGGPRVMLTCGQMGIATGFAAALCIKHDTIPRGIYENYIAELRLLVGATGPVQEKHSPMSRTTHGKYVMDALPETLRDLPRLVVTRGNSAKPAPGYTVSLKQAATLYLAVHNRGTWSPGDEWQRTDMQIHWAPGHQDVVYRRKMAPGAVEIPAHNGKAGPHYGLPHVLFIDAGSAVDDVVDLSAIPAELRPKMTRPGDVAEQ